MTGHFIRNIIDEKTFLKHIDLATLLFGGAAASTVPLYKERLLGSVGLRKLRLRRQVLGIFRNELGADPVSKQFQHLE